MVYGKVVLCLRCYLVYNMDELKNMGIGYYIGQCYFGADGYADDLILFFPTSYGLRIMITVCEKYAILHEVLFNGTKSKIFIYATRRSLIRIFK